MDMLPIGEVSRYVLISKGGSDKRGESCPLPVAVIQLITELIACPRDLLDQDAFQVQPAISDDWRTYVPRGYRG